MQRDKLWEQVPQKELLFRELLKHNQIVEIRGIGLMLAIVYEDAPKAQRVIARCLEEGLLTDWFLFADNCLRIAPPLIISNEQIREACEIILKASDA